MEQQKQPVRFQLSDPREGEYGITYSSTTQAEMESKADDIGSSQFQGVTADSEVIHFRKQAGQWQEFDPQAEQAQADARKLAEQLSQRIQREHQQDSSPATMPDEVRRAFDSMGMDLASEIERRAAQGIEGRVSAYKSAGAGHPEPEVLAPEVARQWAELDAREFRKIQDPQRQEVAALAMGDAARTNAAYKGALAEQTPDIAALVETRSGNDAQARAKVMVTAMAEATKGELSDWEQSQAKQWQYADLKIGDEVLRVGASTGGVVSVDGRSHTPEGHLNTTPEAIEASIRSRLPAAESAASAEQMGIDPAALQRVAAARAADRAAVEKQLGLNAIEPNIEKAQQHLDGEAEAKRQVWLAKATPTPEEGRTGAAKQSENQVESDEIFTARQDIKPVVPTDIEKQYVRVGDKFYHPKNTDLVAFEDKGNKLETKSNSEAIAESMVRIAEARGWDEIKVTGTETFRREVWLEAAARGMHVKGYSPSEQDHAALAARLRESATNTVEKDNLRFRARENSGERAAEARAADAKTNDPQTAQPTQEREDTPIRGAVGVLVAHGAAKYLHDEKNSDSYFVITRDSQGKEKTAWGVDLERAVAEAGAKMGDQIVIANEGQKPVTIMVPTHDKQGNVIGHEEKETHRNAWNVQRAEAFAKDAAEAVKQHPELAGAAAAAAAIDKQAAADGLNAEQRAVVMARVKQNIVNSIERGDIPEVRVRDELVVQRERPASAGQAQEYSR